MTIIHPIASGKGGVGKTVFTANLGAALARRRKTVVLVDLDLGGSNLHTCLGVKNNHAGIGGFVAGRESVFDALLVETGIERLHLVPGDSLVPGTANLPYFVKRKIMKGIGALAADFVILDLGAGASFNTADFWLMSAAGFLVVTPEITSILNAYSLLKTALYRLLQRSFPSRSAERGAIQEFATGRIEGSSETFRGLIGRIGAIKPESGEKVKRSLESLHPKVLLNMSRDAGDIELCSRLRQISVKNLGVDVEYLGAIPWDAGVRASIQARAPLSVTNPGSAFSRGVEAVAEKLLLLKESPSPFLLDPGEDPEAVERVTDTSS